MKLLQLIIGSTLFIIIHTTPSSVKSQNTVIDSNYINRCMKERPCVFWTRITVHNTLFVDIDELDNELILTLNGEKLNRYPLIGPGKHGNSIIKNHYHSNNLASRLKSGKNVLTVTLINHYSSNLNANPSGTKGKIRSDRSTITWNFKNKWGGQGFILQHTIFIDKK